MAKKEKELAAEAVEPVVGSVAKPAAEPAAEPVVNRYRVYCYATTPLANNPFECLAAGEGEAKLLFFSANGITDTVSKIEIEQTG